MAPGQLTYFPYFCNVTETSPDWQPIILTHKWFKKAPERNKQEPEKSEKDLCSGYEKSEETIFFPTVVRKLNK